MRPIRLGLLAASPVPYHVPTYRLLERDPRVDFTAIFCSDDGLVPADVGFGDPTAWGCDLLDGYRSRFLRRAERNRIGKGFFALHDVDVVPLVRRSEFDVLWIHGYNHLTHQLAAGAQRARGGAVMFREEQTLIHPRGVAKTLVKELALRAALRGSCCLYIGTESKRWFEHYGVPEESLFLTPYTVDNEALQARAASAAGSEDELRDSFGIPRDAGPVLLIVSRIVPTKQPDKVLEAFSRIRAEMRCALLVVGEGDLLDRLAGTVHSEGISDVYFAGYLDQTQIWRAYACADVFTLFSALHETWGIVVNEAMNFSLPVIVSDKVGCGRDLVSDGRNGFVVGSDDVTGLTSRLRTLLKDGELRRRYGRESRAIISEWSPEKTAEGVVSAAIAASSAPARLSSPPASQPRARA
jgi:glycosyltransferase involved in cell wall biosynthesis